VFHIEVGNIFFSSFLIDIELYSALQKIPIFIDCIDLHSLFHIILNKLFEISEFYYAHIHYHNSHISCNLKIHCVFI